MSTHPTLSKAETAILVEAAGRPDGRLVFPDGTKPVTRARTLGHLEKEGLIAPGSNDPDEPVLTPAGYCAVGLRPPRRKKAAAEVTGESAVALGLPTGFTSEEPPTYTPPEPIRSPQPGSKGALVVELLGRPEGATLAELAAATGWLPHTIRAALSRLRAGGTELAKAAREAGGTAYHLIRPEPKPSKPRRRAKPADEAALAAVAA